MPDMLRMPAFEIGNPVAFFVLMKTGDLARHFPMRWGNHFAPRIRSI
jgi:hypothetical protein